MLQETIRDNAMNEKSKQKLFPFQKEPTVLYDDELSVLLSTKTTQEVIGKVREK